MADQVTYSLDDVAIASEYWDGTTGYFDAVDKIMAHGHSKDEAVALLDAGVVRYDVADGKTVVTLMM